MAFVGFLQRHRRMARSVLPFQAQTGMLTWNVLTDALDELDIVRAQLREARATERTSRFYRLLRGRPGAAEAGECLANVIELNAGWVLVHWLHDPKAVSLYSSIASTRLALCGDGGFLLVLDEVAERTTLHGPRGDGVQPTLIRSERRILGELRHGLSNKEIAFKLGLSESTVKNYLTELYKKLGDDVGDRLQAVMLTRDWNLEDEG
jgi:DNA-binding CsgD family transcriptional regulator